MKYNDKLPYIRVGTNYYKVVHKPLISGDTIEILVLWNKETIKLDHPGVDLKNEIPQYDGFCNIPNHKDYKQEIGSFLNRYEPINYKPKPGEHHTFDQFLKHIFQDQYEIGLDYLSLLYLRPTQLLPILCLVSKERNTGKTTFLNMLKEIFGLNMTYNKNEDFRSQFNSDWASKLIIAVDEVLLDKREDSERIKNLSTARTFKAEAKGKDRLEVEFFGKFILCSNNEDSFIQIDPGETRYWVIKVKQFIKENVFLLEQLRAEIPAFLHFLINRVISTQNTSRMWFEPKLLRTKALQRIIHKNRSRIETEMLQILSDLLSEHDSEIVELCLGDIIPFLNQSGVRNCQRSDIKEVLQGAWNLEPQKNANSYVKYTISAMGTTSKNKSKGRYYTLTKGFVDEKMKEDD